MISGSTKKHRGGESVHLGEVCFNMPPKDLRIVGAFLIEMADQIEQRKMLDHAHIVEFDETWDERHPKYDVIVRRPGSVS